MKKKIEYNYQSTVSLESTNFIISFFLKRVYRQALKLTKKKNFSKIFDFGSGTRNLKKINFKTYKLKYTDYDILRDDENIFDIIDKLDQKTLFISLNVFMYLEERFIDELVFFLKEKGINILLNISKNYLFKKKLFLIFNNYKKAFTNTLTYETQIKLIEKHYKIVDKKNLYFSDLIYCEPKTKITY